MRSHLALLRTGLYIAIALLAAASLMSLPHKTDAPAFADGNDPQNIATLPTSSDPVSEQPLSEAERASVISEAAQESQNDSGVLGTTQAQPALADNGQVAFSREDGSLYITDAQGTNPQRRAADLQNIEWPEWSHSAEYLAVAAAGATAQERCLHIVHPVVDTNYKLACGFTTIAEPRWSPNEDRLAFLGRRSGDTFDHIFIVDRGGGYITRVMRGRPQRWSPAWLDDYTVVVPGATTTARDAWQLFRVDLRQPEVGTPISGTRTCSGCNCGAADWMAFPGLSPDGRRIAYLGGRTEGGKLGGCTSYYSVYLVNPWSETVEEERIADVSATGSGGPLRWSPDNRQVAVFGGESDGRLYINLVDTATRARRVLRSFSSPGNETLDYSWAPDATSLIAQYKPQGNTFSLGRVDVTVEPDTITPILEGLGPAWAALRAPTRIERPLIFIPGILGSSLNEIQGGNVGKEFWPGQPTLCTDHLALRLDSGRTFVAKDAIRTHVAFALCDSQPVNVTAVYQPMLDALRDRGYKEYVTDGAGTNRTAGGCDESQRANNPTLFVFAYDWRRSNSESAALLEEYVSCIQRIHGPDTKVDIMTHSMGGLVARRYVLNNYQSHSVARLITVAAPWLGAPKALTVMNSGWYNPFTPALLLPGELRDLARGFPGVYELLPSPSYYTFVGTPLFASYIERASRTLDCTRDATGKFVCGRRPLTYPQTVELIRELYRGGDLADGNQTFHGFVNSNGAGQDNWGSDSSQVEYHHVIGVQHNRATIEQLQAAVEIVCQMPGPGGEAKCTPVDAFFVEGYGFGDGTVPEYSATRCRAVLSQIVAAASCTGGEDTNLNASSARLLPVVARTAEESELTEHTTLMRNPRVIRAVTDILGNVQRGGAMAGEGVLNQEITSAPTYYIKATGTLTLTVIDAEGRSTTDPIIFQNPVPGVTVDQVGDAAFQATLSAGRVYTMTIQSDGGPISLELTRGDGVTSDEAVRYLDVSLPGNTRGVMTFSSAGAGELRYDADGDGNAETVVAPTARLVGPEASDTDAPELSADRSGPLNQMAVTLEATESGSGVAFVRYSLDGENYRLYDGPFELDAGQTARVFAFAEDRAGNRSELFVITLVDRVFLPILRR